MRGFPSGAAPNESKETGANLLKLMNTSLVPRSTVRSELLGRSSSLSSEKFEWPKCSAIKSGVNLLREDQMHKLTDQDFILIRICRVAYIC